MTHFLVFSGRSTLVEVNLKASRSRQSFEVRETDRIGFEVDDYEEDVAYEILIGDIPLSEPPQERRNRMEWAASACLDGASGVTPITLRDARSNAPLAQTLALVEPSKLSSAAFENMLEDMRQIGAELLFDLISKSRMGLGSAETSNRRGIRPLSSHLELGSIRDFWREFSKVLAEILNEPHTELRTSHSVRRVQPGERLHASTLKGFAQKGVRARDAMRSGRMLALPTSVQSRDTRENRIIGGFIRLLRERIARCLAQARDEIRAHTERLHMYGEDNPDLVRFMQLREGPKLEKLREVVEESEELAGAMARAMRSLGVASGPITLQELHRGLETPVFRNHPSYALAGRQMRRFLGRSEIVIEERGAARAKSMETIYEQWVFFQVMRAILAAGLTCISHNSVFETVSRNRFMVDVDRNSAIDFKAPDGRIVRIRYEPTVLPRHAAQGEDSIYRGHSTSAWTPDLVLEVFAPRADKSRYGLTYAVVIDAKYTTPSNIWQRLEGIEKYREIRSVETDAQIVRQVWVAAPVRPMLGLRDEAVTWSSRGEVGADALDVLLGVIGADPADREETAKILVSLVLGVLNHAATFSERT